MISIDTETTGLDLYHGAKPYFVTICKPGGGQIYWEWPVNPYNREPQIPREDIEEILHEVLTADGIVFQNGKFDVAALNTIDSRFGKEWPWDKCYDTIIAGHLLASNRPHNLTDMAIQYLGWDIHPFEESIKKITNQARRVVRSIAKKSDKKNHKEWRIANAGLPEMPSAKETTWKYDMWLPKAMVAAYGIPFLRDDKWVENVELWSTALRDYANTDSAITLALITVQIELIKERGLWEIFLERLKILRVAYLIESRGVTLSRFRLKEKYDEYQEESKLAEEKCKEIASTYDHSLVLPKSGMNKSLSSFCFSESGLNLPVEKRGKKSEAPSLDKEVMSTYELELPPDSDQSRFIKLLASKRKRDTAINYMDGYKRFARLYRDLPSEEVRSKEWVVLHPFLNPTGTATLRWSSQNPNEQNISKQEGFNLRYSFGPVPGREWWSLDAKNIELRLPAYRSGEEALIAVFDRPDDPPYFGSYHLVIFDALHPEKFAEHGDKCKELYDSTWYQWVKNGNFALIYGSQETNADLTYRVPGAYKLIRSRFPKIAALSDYQIRFAETNGFVETIPDKSVNPKRGYPLLCTRTEYGSILPTVPLNYHIQGSACWWMGKAMVRVQEFFDFLNSGRKFLGRVWEGGYYIVLQVHDELVPDMPSGRGKGENPYDYNLPIVKEVSRLMSLGGDDLGVPTPVGAKFHEANWSSGVKLF